MLIEFHLCYEPGDSEEFLICFLYFRRKFICHLFDIRRVSRIFRREVVEKRFFDESGRITVFRREEVEKRVFVRNRFPPSSNTLLVSNLLYSWDSASEMIELLSPSHEEYKLFILIHKGYKTSEILTPMHILRHSSFQWTMQKVLHVILSVFWPSLLPLMKWKKKQTNKNITIEWMK